MKLFESALGQHNIISILSKDFKGTKIKIIETKYNINMNPNILYKILHTQDENTDYFFVDNSLIYDGKDNYIRFSPMVHIYKNSLESLYDKFSENSELLGEIARINQGVVSG